MRLFFLRSCVSFLFEVSSPEIALHKKRRYEGKSNELCEAHAERL